MLVHLAGAGKVAKCARNLAWRLARVGNKRADLWIGPLPLDQHVVKSIRRGSVEGAGSDYADHALQGRRIPAADLRRHPPRELGRFGDELVGQSVEDVDSDLCELLTLARQPDRL